MLYKYYISIFSFCVVYKKIWSSKSNYLFKHCFPEEGSFRELV